MSEYEDIDQEELYIIGCPHCESSYDARDFFTPEEESAEILVKCPECESLFIISELTIYATKVYEQIYNN